MNQLFLFVILIAIIGIGYYFYTKSITNSAPTTTIAPISSSPTVTAVVKPLPTLPPFSIVTPPPVTTKYPLTEQAVLMTFTQPTSIPYKTKYSQTIFNNLFTSQQKDDVIRRMYTDHKNIDTPSLNCYALYTNVFLYPYQGVDTYSAEYDIIGAYFIMNLKNYIPDTSSISYYDNTKKIVISADILQQVMTYWNLKDSTNKFFFSGGEMPMLLDDFVPRLSKYLFSNYASLYTYVNQAVNYTNMKATCS